MSGGLTICAISEPTKERLRQFRFAKSATMDAIVLKIDRESHELIIDEEMNDSSIEEVRESLPEQQPRFILLNFAYKHEDGRVSYPMCLIFFSPSGCSPEQQMLYAGSRNNLVRESEITKSMEIREQDELTQEYLESKVV